MATKRAVVLLSGGLDSSTVLAQALADGCEVVALSFRYGQTHERELDMAHWQSKRQGASEHVVIDINMDPIGGSLLIPDGKHAADADGSDIPPTYVPARNTVFLSFALGLAEVTGAERIYAGMNAVDYSGYPDCRPEYCRAWTEMANLATRACVDGKMNLALVTPLLNMTKGEIVARAIDLGVDLAHTNSCYFPTADGKACGECDSCLLRLKGFLEAGEDDPVAYAG